MRKVKWILPVLIAVYVAGFFLYAPVHMTAISFDSPSLARAASACDDVLYYSWISKLDQHNLLVTVRHRNIVFWCGRFESCTVEDAEESAKPRSSAS